MVCCRRIRPSTRATYAALRRRDDGDGALATVGELAADVGVSPRSIRYAVDDLEAAGVVERRRTGRASLYLVQGALDERGPSEVRASPGPHAGVPTNAHTVPVTRVSVQTDTAEQLDLPLQIDEPTGHQARVAALEARVATLEAQVAALIADRQPIGNANPADRQPIGNAEPRARTQDSLSGLIERENPPYPPDGQIPDGQASDGQVVPITSEVRDTDEALRRRAVAEARAKHAAGRVRDVGAYAATLLDDSKWRSRQLAYLATPRPAAQSGAQPVDDESPPAELTGDPECEACGDGGILYKAGGQLEYCACSAGEVARDEGGMWTRRYGLAL